MGRAHAVGLAREGCDLVIGDICEGLPDGAPYPKATRADLEETVRLVEAEGRRCVAAVMDVGQPAEAADLIEQAVRTFGRLDFLVSNAAFTLEAPIFDTAPGRFAAVIRANLEGAFNVLSPALRVMTKAKRGRVVVIGSGEPACRGQRRALCRLQVRSRRPDEDGGPGSRALRRHRQRRPARSHRHPDDGQPDPLSAGGSGQAGRDP